MPLATGTEQRRSGMGGLVKRNLKSLNAASPEAALGRIHLPAQRALHLAVVLPSLPLTEAVCLPRQHLVLKLLFCDSTKGSCARWQDPQNGSLSLSLLVFGLEHKYNLNENSIKHFA